MKYSTFAEHSGEESWTGREGGVTTVWGGEDNRAGITDRHWGQGQRTGTENRDRQQGQRTATEDRDRGHRRAQWCQVQATWLQ